MIRGRTLFRGFMVFLLTLTVMVILFVFGILRFFTTTILNQVEAELGESAVLIANLLRYNDQLGIVDYDMFCKQAGASGATRVTLIATDGRVLGDSHADISDLNNHGDRPEIRSARLDGQGSAIRHSASLGYRLMYYALAVEVGGERMVIRTSRSITAVDSRLRTVSRTLQLIGLAFFLTAVLLAASAGQWIRRPLQRLMAVASALGAGDLSVRSTVEKPEEFATLGRTLNTMSMRLSRRIETIQRQRDEHQSVLTGMSEAVMVLDDELKVLEFNRAAERIFMKTRNEIRDRPLLEAVRNSGIQDFAEQVRSSAGALHRELSLYPVEGGDRQYHLQLHGNSLRGEGGEESRGRIVLVFTDITSIKRSEQIRKDFVSNVSHELKTPITSIKGFVETLQDGAAEDPALRERFLGIIARQADGMHAIIEDLLQLSRLDEHSHGSGETLFDLQDASERAAERLRPAASGKGMVFTIKREDALIIQGNPGLLEQAIFNLLDNGIKYSLPGGSLTLELQKMGPSARIEVRDTGIGIPEQDLPRIFERFYRVDKARSRETGGTGLGLAIVKHIVLVHGGEISVESQPGKGSRFVISLPLAVNDDEAP